MAEGRTEISDSATIFRRAPGVQFDGLYVHAPFCSGKCAYCDFYSVVAGQEVHRAFAERLAQEALAVGARVALPLRTVFIGGGTPTLLNAGLWRQILAALHEAFDLAALEEFTVEANPETLSPALLDVLTEGGVNRISIGAQSFDSRHLRTLGRRHSADQTARAVELARSAGLDNVSLDLIFAVPWQTLAEWDSDLGAALALSPQHISCYGLTYEPGTPISRQVASGELSACDEAVEAAMYECTIHRLTGAGYEHYEISNFALPGRRCLHNMLYWTGGQWLALGPGASGYAGGVRWKNAPDLDAYLSSEGGAPLAEVEQLDSDRSFGEQLMLRLRLIEGASLEWLERRLAPRRRGVIERFIQDGLLERTRSQLRLTRRGLLLADTVVTDLL